MAVYLVTYDLRQPGRDYSRLYQAIQSVPCIRALESVWFIEHGGSGAAAIRDWLTGFIDENDRLFVSRQTRDWGSRWLMNQAGDWLNGRQV